jgi:Nitrile hydratase beta subunit, C-terminal
MQAVAGSSGGQYPTRRPAAPARFAPGDRVRVRDSAPLGHIRTPFYIRGHAGVIERYCGAFPNPEELAQMRDGLPAQPLYRVRFLQREVWPDYVGRPEDTIDIEIFQHWLEGLQAGADATSPPPSARPRARR